MLAVVSVNILWARRLLIGVPTFVDRCEHLLWAKTASLWSLSANDVDSFLLNGTASFRETDNSRAIGLMRLEMPHFVCIFPHIFGVIVVNRVNRYSFLSCLVGLQQSVALCRTF